MKPCILVVFLVALVALPLQAQDPIQPDPDKYTVVLENEQVRVLDYCDKPGDRTALHHYPSFVLYALSPFTRTLTLADGKRVTRTFQTGDVAWMEAQSHIVRTSGIPIRMS